MLQLIQTGFAVFTFLAILGVNYLVFFGTWNLLARVILMLAPQLDLRVCQQFETTHDAEGKPVSSPVHTPVQWIIFLVLCIPWFMSCYYCVAKVLHWVTH